MDLHTLRKKLNINEILDYKESLDAMGLLQNANDIDNKRAKGNG